MGCPCLQSWTFLRNSIFSNEENDFFGRTCDSVSRQINPANPERLVPANSGLTPPAVPTLPAPLVPAALL